jgi:hypothetical protein
MLMGNIINFPSNLDGPVKQDHPDFYEQEVQKAFIEDFIERFGHGLAGELNRNGFDVDHDEFILRYMYALEVLKSVLYHNKKIDHVLSNMILKQSKKYFEAMENNE